MLNSPLSWLGGKSKLRKEIIKHFPEHSTYIEVFGGAGWVYFGKEPSKVEVFNDINRELINFFRIIKHHKTEFIKSLSSDIVSRDMFDEYYNSNLNHLTDIQRAVRFFYTVKYSFGSMGNHFGYSTKTSPRKHIFDLSQFQEIRSRLQNTYVENLSFDILIPKYDNENSLFFCDPPYLDTSGYEYPFNETDHIKLKDTLSTISGKFILTINDHPKIRELYKEYNIKETEVAYSISKESKGRKNYKELIITNY